MAEWFKALDWICEGQGFESWHGTNILWQDINMHLLLSTQVLNGYPVGCDCHCWSNSFRVSSNAWLECSPGSGDCAHTVCGQVLNPMPGVIVYRRCIRHYIKVEYYYYLLLLLLLLLLIMIVIINTTCTTTTTNKNNNNSLFPFLFLFSNGKLNCYERKIINTQKN